MRHAFLRLFIIISLLLITAVAMPLAQDDPIVTVTPDTGVVGSAILEVSGSGLIADESYTIEFLYQGVVVFSTDEVADMDGNVTFVAASTEDDEAGIYTVQLLNNGDIIAVSEFEFTENDREATLGTIGNINISPSSGPISTLHTIIIRDLDADASYTVEITASETDEIVYRRVWTANEQGRISIEIFAEDGDTTGQQVVAVIDSAGDIVAQGEFTIDEPPTRNIVVDITPSVAQAGREFTITVNGLAAFDTVIAQITSPSNVLVDTIRARASSQGVAVLSFMSSDELEADTYNVAIFVDDERMTETTLSIGDVDTADDTKDVVDSEVAVSVDPESGAIRTRHVMTVTGLNAEQPFILTIRNDAGDVEYSATRTADESGEFVFNISSAEGDEFGTYPVEVSDATTGKTLATAQMIIAEGDAPVASVAGDNTQQAGSPAVTVSPESGEIGTSYVITLSGMPTDQRIGVVIRAVSDDTLALSSVVTTDDNGSGTLEFTSRALNAPGDYRVTVVQPSGDLASAILIVEGAIASIEPQAGIAGTTHVITVEGLNADEIASVDVTFDSESVYTTEITADTDGIATFELTTEASDPIGDYTISVSRESGNQPTVNLTLTEDEVESPPDTTEDDNTNEPTTNAQVIEGRLSDEVEAVEFEGEEGQYVIVTVESDDFDTVASVYDTDSYEIAYNDDSMGELNSRIGPLLLPYSGEYTLEVSQSYYDEENLGGDFVATIEFVSIATIEFDEPVAFALSPENSDHYYELSVEAGDSFNIMVDSNGAIDTVMRVLSSDGYEFAFDDDSGAGFDAEFNNLIFDTGGTYILVVSSFAEDVTGEGVVMVSRNPLKSLDEGAVRITLSDKIYRDLVVFEGEEGQVITLNLERLSGDVEDLYVYANIDGMQIMSYSTMGVPDNLPLTFVMPMSGQVIITLEEYSYGGGITLNITVDKQ